MPKTKISEFSATPANNTDIDSINLAEGCAPSGINDAIRELMSQLKDFQTGAVGDSFNGPVGSTTAAAGAFTTLSATSTLSVTGAGSIQGLTVGRGAGAVATNTVVGASALASNTTGANNLALGVNALGSNTTASFNVAVGGAAIFANTTGNRVVAVGYNAAYNNTTGVENTAIGHDAFSVNTTGSNNVVVGRSALSQNTTASYNTAVGYQAAYSNTTGAYNTVVGLAAGYTNTTGNYNTYVGWSAGYSSTGTQNTFIGQGAGYYITSGTENTIIGGYAGNQSGLDIRTGSNNIVISDGAGNPRLYYFGPDSAWKSKEIYNFTSANTANMYIGSGYDIGRVTSALKYKQDVRDIESIDITKFRPVRYKSKCANDDQTKDYFGFIADEVADAGIEELVIRNADNEVESFAYDRMTVVLLKAIQELKAEFDAYKASHP